MLWAGPMQKRSYFCLMVISLTFAVAVVRAQAQQTITRPAEISRLRRDLVAAIGPDFELTKDEVTTGPAELSGLTYWLAWVRAKRPGHFTITYAINFRDGSYVRGERSYELRIGPAGCRRSLMPYVSAGNYCLGDTVILPIRLQGYLNHKFSVKETADDNPITADPTVRLPDGLNIRQPPPESVINPLNGILNFLGTARNEFLRANLSVVVEYSAVFQADRAGRFNLAVRTDAAETSRSEPPNQDLDNDLSIIVVDRTTPVTFLAAQENTIDYTKDPRVTVGNSNSYLTRTLILQSGDIISLPYASKYRPAKAIGAGLPAEDNPNSTALRPLILRREFKPKKDGFDAWIQNYLPS
jgi:hypothetical protein